MKFFFEDLKEKCAVFFWYCEKKTFTKCFFFFSLPLGIAPIDSEYFVQSLWCFKIDRNKSYVFFSCDPGIFGVL